MNLSTLFVHNLCKNVALTSRPTEEHTQPETVRVRWPDIWSAEDVWLGGASWPQIPVTTVQPVLNFIVSEQNNTESSLARFQKREMESA